MLHPMNTKTKVMVTLLVAFVFAAGCKKKDESPVGETAQEAMGLYAQGFNALLEEPRRMIDEYVKKVPEDGPDPAKPAKLFPHHNRAETKIAEAKKAFDAAKSKAPPSLSKLAPLAEDAITHVNTVRTKYAAAHTYFDAENFKEDGGAKGKELHSELLAAVKAYRDAMRKLGAELSAVEDEQALAEIKKFESAKSYSYWFRFYNIRAKKFVDATQAGDADAVTSALAPLDEAHGGLTAFAQSKTDKPNAAFKAYVAQAESFHNTAQKVARDLKEGGDKQDRLAEQVVQNYNNLISMTNSLFELEANNALK
jgi:hypothetical protein